MNKILKWFSLLFAVSITIFVIYFLYDINKDMYIQKPQPLEVKSLVQKQEAQAFWLNHLSKTKKRGYYFPVDEVYIQTELEPIKKEQKPYKLFVENLDPYQIFCLEQELKNFGLRYLFQKQKKELSLLVFSKDIKKLKSLVKVLRRYQIQAKIIKG